MHSLKPSRGDGLGAIFSKRFWNIIGKKVVNFCIASLKGDYNIAEINQTRIVIIPKLSCPTQMSHFRPISLCSILYKLIAKMLVNRFQKVLHLCIDEAHSAFIPGRLITDNIIATYENLHSLRKKRFSGEGSFALKVDMSKEYDRVEWEFIKVMLCLMGFFGDVDSESNDVCRNNVLCSGLKW